MEASAFLQLFYQPDEPIFFSVGGKTWKNKPQTYAQAEPKLQQHNGHQDIYFVVNSGGSRDAHITRINALFADWDCGKDEQGGYFPEDIVAHKKETFLETVNAFPLEPSVIIETRNGYHVYFLVSDCPVADFSAWQKRLAAALESDPSVCNPARLMRLPGYDWVKPGSGCTRFRISVLRFSGKRYSMEHIRRALPCNEQEGEGDDGRISTPNKHHTYFSVIGVEKSPPVVETASSMREAIDRLKRQSLAEYMGLGQSEADPMTIVCPFHQDDSPSASLFRDGDGKWHFRCHAAGCGVKGSIIDIAMRKLGVDRKTAISKLLERYGIQVRSDWAEKQKEILSQNIVILENEEAFRGSYPHLYRLIGRVIRDLILKLEHAKEAIVSEKYSVDGQVVFFGSLRHFEKLRKGDLGGGGSHRKHHRRVDRYCLLGLMRKLSEQQIPPEMLQRANQMRKQKCQSFRVQFYSIPAYTGELLAQAEQRARILVESGASVTGISPQLVTQLYGEQVAREVYPDRGSWVASEADAEFAEQVEKILLGQLKDKGYATARGVWEKLLSYKDWKTVTWVRLSRCLPSLMSKHDLRSVQSNGKLKKRLSIPGAGYPRILIRQKDLAEAET